MDNSEEHAAELCITIIKKRIPLTSGEERLLSLIINDIQLRFGLEGALPQPRFEETGNGPTEWFW